HAEPAARSRGRGYFPLGRFRGSLLPIRSWHGLLVEKRKGDPASRLPLQEPDWVRRFDWMPADLVWSTVYSAAASVIGTTDTKVRRLALVRYSIRPSTKAKSVCSF